MGEALLVDDYATLGCSTARPVTYPVLSLA